MIKRPEEFEKTAKSRSIEMFTVNGQSWKLLRTVYHDRPTSWRAVCKSPVDADSIVSAESKAQLISRIKTYIRKNKNVK